MAISKRLNGLDLFSGIGGNTLGLRDYIKTIAYCEQDKHAQSVLLSRMYAGEIEPAPVWDNIKTLNKDLFDVPIDIIVGGFPCFVAGTSILTRNGYRSIEDVEIGDEVLTHTGLWKRVNQKHVTHNRATRIIKGTGFLPLETTDEHPFYIRRKGRRWDNDKRRYIRNFEKPDWVCAKDVQTGDFVGKVLPNEPQYIPDNQNADFWWLVGRYIADGWLVNRKDRGNGQTCRVVFGIGKQKAEAFEKILCRVFHGCPVEERTAIKYHVTNKDFAEFLKQIGRKAPNKQIPTRWFSLQENLMRSLLDGYLSGDGSIFKNGKKCSTASKGLALGIAMLVQRAYGLHASVFYSKKPKTYVIEGRTVNQKDSYAVQISEHNRSSFVEGDYGWGGVRKNTVTGNYKTVYNIGVEDDESYIANGAIVHNCQDISVAGHGDGIVEGNRSGLFYEVVRLAGELRPQFLFLENVPAIRSKGLDIVIKELTKKRYDLRWCTLSAADVGAAHRRERWFMLAHRRSPNSANPNSNG